MVEESKSLELGLSQKRSGETEPGHPIPTSPYQRRGGSPLHEHNASSGQIQAQTTYPANLTESLRFPHPSTAMTAAQLQDVYTAIFFKLGEVQEEKVEIETSLKAEIINAEEQRAYIEVLKAALELKLEELGITCTDISNFSEWASLKLESENYRKDSVRLSSIVADQEAQIGRLNGQLRKIQSEMEKVARSKADIQLDISREVEAANSAKESLKKVDEEKQALLDYVEEQTAQIKIKNEEVQLTKAKQESIIRQNEQLQAMNAGLKDDIEALNGTIKTLRTEIIEKDSTIEAEKQTLEDIYNELTLKEQENETLRDQLTRHQADQNTHKTKMDHQVSMLGSEIAKHKDEISERLKQITQHKVKASEDQANIESLNMQLLNCKNKNETLQDNFSAISNTLKETQNEKDALQADYDKAVAQIRSLEAIQKQLQERIGESEVDRKELSVQIIAMQEKLDDSAVKYENVIEQLRSDVGQQTEFAKSYQEKHVHAATQKSEVEETLRMTEQKLLDATEETKQLHDELRFTHERFSDRERQLSTDLVNAEAKTQQQEAEIQTLQSDMQSLRIEHEGLATKLLKAERTAEELSVSLKLAEQDLKAAQAEVSRLETSVSTLTYSRQMTEDDLAQQRLRNEDLLAQIQARVTDLAKAEDQVRSISTEKDMVAQRLDFTTQELQTVSAEKTEALNRVTRQKIKKGNQKRQLLEQGNELGEYRAVVEESLSHINLSNPAISSPLKKLVSKHIGMPSEKLPISSLKEWVQGSVKELEVLVLHNANLSAELAKTRNEAAAAQDAASRDLQDLAQRSNMQAASLESEKNTEIQTLKTTVEEIRSHSDRLSTENDQLSRDYHSVLEELTTLRHRYNQVMEDTVKWRQNAETEMAQITHLEETNALLVMEKKSLEGLLGRAQMNIPIISIQRIFQDIMKARNEIEIAERERLTIQRQLSINEQGRDLRAVEQIKEQLQSYENHISLYRRRLTSLEDELQQIEAGERRKFRQADSQ